MKQALLLAIGMLISPLISIAHADTYSFGVVPQFSSERISKTWEPILDLLEKETGYQFELYGSLDIPAFERHFSKGHFDFAYMNPYHAIVAHEEEGYEPIIRDVGRNLYGILVTRKDSSIKSMQELDGKKVAFPAPNALGASLMPRAEFSQQHKIAVDEVYVSSHSSVYLNVVLGLAAAGGGVQKTLSQQPAKIQSQLKIISKTQEVPAHPISAHQRVPEKVKQAVANAFIHLAGTPYGAKLLNKIPMKVAGNTSIKEYDVLRSMGLDEFYIK